MALETNELRVSSAGRGSEIRMVQRQNKVITLAAISGATLLIKGLPLAYNTSTDLWVPYTQPSDAASFTLTRDAGAGDGGSFQLSVDGLAVVMDWDENTAGVLAKINNVLDGAKKDYQVTVANSGSGTDLGTSANVQTITFGELAGAPDVIYDGAGLTDGGLNEPTGIAIATVDAGTNLNGTNEIRGFIADVDDVQTHASDEVQALAMIDGEIHRDDVNTAAMLLLLVGSPSEAELDTALRATAVRERQLTIRGLSEVR